MSEEKQVRQEQTVEIVSYTSKPFGWFLHLKYKNDTGATVYTQAGFGQFPDEANGIFPLWKSPLEPVRIQCPANPLFSDYTGDLLVPIPEVVIQTMFTGAPTQPRTGPRLR